MEGLLKQHEIVLVPKVKIGQLFHLLVHMIAIFSHLEFPLDAQQIFPVGQSLFSSHWKLKGSSSNPDGGQQPGHLTESSRASSERTVRVLAWSWSSTTGFFASEASSTSVRNELHGNEEDVGKV